jgi:beta-lactamase regulating signal transducer with metallopeptidase domain
MIAYRMLYAMVVGLPVLAATLGVAAVLRRHGKAERWVWLVGLVLALALPALYLSTSLRLSPPMAAVSGDPAGLTGAGNVPDDPGFARFFPVIRVPHAQAGFGLDETLLLAWILVSGGLALRWLVSGRRLTRLMRSWRPESVDGTEVWLTATSGPAVTGVLRSRILVPEWLLGLSPEERSLVLLHEAEHVRARDPWLMAVTRISRILAPWNPVVWMLSSRLLRAVEMDCDRRVLSLRPDVRAYCDTLFAISARAPSRLVGAAAFAEPRVPLQERIVAMTTPTRSISVVGATLVLALGAILVVGSCGVPLPTDRETDPRQGIVGETDERIIPVSLGSDGRVVIDGQNTPRDDVSDVIAARITAAPQPLVARLEIPMSVPFRYVDELQKALVAGGLTRVIFSGPTQESDLAIVLPERLEQAQVSGRNVLKIVVQPTGELEVRRLRSDDVRNVDPDGLAEIWRTQVAENPRLIASLANEPDATYAQVTAALGALQRANAQRIALMGQTAQ